MDLILKMKNKKIREMRIAFIGSAGIPNRYGGFESFLEHCGPSIAEVTELTIVTCDAALYLNDNSSDFKGVHRIFLETRANGASSILHDLLAFFRVYFKSTHIMILGVSGGPWFPFFQLMCRLGGKRLGVNIDGVEWRRSKFNNTKKIILRIFDYLAQRFSDVVVYDNAGLFEYVLPVARKKAIEIGYSGDHVLRLPNVKKEALTGLTVCRIEPENNLDLIIEGVLQSDLKRYTIVGNWSHSAYSRALRKRYTNVKKLQLLDSIYEPNRLAELRESCDIYLHGHSVGGTNPSLVEMLFYDCTILCFDVDYNRITAGPCAYYFADVGSLSSTINLVISGNYNVDVSGRNDIRKKYTSTAIAEAYLLALQG